MLPQDVDRLPKDAVGKYFFELTGGACDGGPPQRANRLHSKDIRNGSRKLSWMLYPGVAYPRDSGILTQPESWVEPTLAVLRSPRLPRCILASKLEGMEILFGLHPVEEALRSGTRKFDHICIARERQDARLEKLIRPAVTRE